MATVLVPTWITPVSWRMPAAAKAASYLPDNHMRGISGLRSGLKRWPLGRFNQPMQNLPTHRRKICIKTSMSLLYLMSWEHPFRAQKMANWDFALVAGVVDTGDQQRTRSKLCEVSETSPWLICLVKAVWWKRQKQTNPNGTVLFQDVICRGLLRRLPA